MTSPTEDPWAAFAADPGGSAVLTDFDGTLSNVVVDPEAARPLPDVVECLETLAHRAHTVAVISGRPLEFLTPHFGEDVTLAGLYGLETRRDGVVTRLATVEDWRSVIAETVARAQAELPDDVLIESKGLALTLHYRSAPERRSTIETWAESWASHTGLRVAEARCSVELNPPVDVDKGTVATELATAPGIRRACYFGDDRGDIAAFTALRRLGGHQIDTRTVAVRGPEAPPELLEVADQIVDGPAEVLALLEALVPTD